MNVGICAEFRCVVRRKNNTIKKDMGYQKNLILDKGLDFFGSASHSEFNRYCAVGEGNSAPTTGQTALDKITSFNESSTDEGTSVEYDNITDGDVYKVHQLRRFRFKGMGNVNISELGLVSEYRSKTNYYLCTRALIKDANGDPTTITVLEDETLDVYYRVYQVFELNAITGRVMLTDADGGTVEYNYTSQLYNVGREDKNGYSYGICKPLKGLGYSSRGLFAISTDEPTDIKELPRSYFHVRNKIYNDKFDLAYAPYDNGSFTRRASWDLRLDDANGDIRTVYVKTTLGQWQYRYGSVAGDNPITKTSDKEMTFEFEFKWGRYEGEL